MDDTLDRYDPLEAVTRVSEATGVDPRTVALVLEGEIDYLGCLGMLDTWEMDEAARDEIEDLQRENADLLEDSDGEYELGTAVAFVQRNRGIATDVIRRVLEANFRFMDERGFLDEEWGTEVPDAKPDSEA